MASRFRLALGMLAISLVAACSGGGCGGGCGGTPLPGGFPKEKTVENAAGVRVSRPGIDFLEKALPNTVATIAKAQNGKLGFDIPNVDPGASEIANLGIGKLLFDPNVCVGGPDPKANPPKCRAEINIGAALFSAEAVTPSSIKARAVVPVMVSSTPVNAKLTADPIIGGNFDIGSLTVYIGYGDGGCSNGKPNVTPHNLPIGVSIPFVAENIAPRDGYTKIDVKNATVDLSGLNGDDVKICSDCGFASDICSAITNSGFVKDLVIGPLKSGLEGQVRNLLEAQLCTKPNTALNPACPTGSKPDGKNEYCVYNSKPDTCVPTLLGTDMHLDISGALQSISPGVTGGLDFGLAAGGAMQPFPKLGPAGPANKTPNGITLGMIGGVVPQPPSKCVPFADVKPPTGIPMPDELAPTKADDPTAPHVGLALSGRFLDYAFANVYNSGFLCLGISSEQIDMLKSGLLSIIIPSIKGLTFEQGDAAAAIATRPQTPPRVTLGTGADVNKDPLIKVQLDKFAIDFYVWSYDRFVRALTFTADVTVPLNITVAKGKDGKTTGIQPTLGDLVVANAVVTNSELLTDDPGIVAASLGGLLGGLGKTLVGSGISPIDLASSIKSLGLDLDIKDIKRLTKDKDQFIGVFASLAQPGTKATIEAETQAKLVSKTVDATRMGITTLTRGAAEIVVEAGSPLDDGRHAVEYRWNIDHGTTSEWTANKKLVIRDDQLLVQGRHVLYVSARLAGEADTEDATPAEVPFVIDATAPFVRVSREGGSAKISAWDLVSANDKLVGRVRFDDGTFGDFRPLADIARVETGHADIMEIEVKDEEGNVASVRQELRGKSDPTIAAAGSGCSCDAPGAGSKNAGGLAAVALALVAIGAIALRRRGGAFVKASHRAALGLGAITVVAATSEGCACGSEAESEDAKCGPKCDQECKGSLPQGLPGSYTSIAKAKDGAIWVAGYNDALLDQGDALLWGDLVVGKYDLGKQRVDWQTVDGVPTRDVGKDGCADFAPNTWRKGEKDSGDNVGLWTSIQVSDKGRPMVSYYDVTNHRLKFAYLDGSEWKNFVVKEIPNGDAGRYSKLLFVDGKPQVAFLAFEPGNMGKTRSKVILAKSREEEPSEGAQFDFEDVTVEEDNPCRANSCPGGSVCAKEGVCLPSVSGCTPADCGMGKACATKDAKATCVSVASSIETYPNVFGAFISFAQNGPNRGIVVYDRPHGNLVALVNNGSKWDRIIVDGETGDRAKKTAIDTGDTGVAASLSIDAGNVWHISYVNGIDETLRYITLTGGKPGKSQVIDDGTAVDGRPHADGKHIVGDDSFIRADGDIITVVYQDATQGTLRRAVGTTSGATKKWDLRVVAQPNRFAGFFPQLVPGEDKIANFWRETDRGAKSVTGDVSILAP